MTFCNSLEIGSTSEGLEVPIMDYLSHQLRLMPPLAAT